jgi:hypothetical protein
MLGGSAFRHTFSVCPLPTEATGLLGTDFIEKASAVVSFESCELAFALDELEPPVRNDAHEERTALTVFAKGKEGHSTQSQQQETKRRADKVQASPVAKRPPLRCGRGL